MPSMDGPLTLGRIKMISTVSIWLLVAAFLGAGTFNAIGTRATRENFVRWGYPGWWCQVTGGLEILAAALIAFPSSRPVGLILGAVVILAAAATVLRRREWVHMAPIGVFLVLLAAEALAP